MYTHIHVHVPVQLTLSDGIYPLPWLPVTLAAVPPSSGLLASPEPVNTHNTALEQGKKALGVGGVQSTHTYSRALGMGGREGDLPPETETAGSGAPC